MNARTVMLDGPRPARFTVDEYFELDATGIFERHGRTELIQGEIYVMSAQHRRHSRIKGQLAREIERAIEGTKWSVLIEVTVRMAPDDAPDPDIVVTSEPDGDGPVPLASVGLIVEISNSSLAFDLGAKAQSYARAGVLEYWVVDPQGRRVYCHATPGADGYPEPVKVPFGDNLVAATLGGLVVRTDGLN